MSTLLQLFPVSSVLVYPANFGLSKILPTCESILLNLFLSPHKHTYIHIYVYTHIFTYTHMHTHIHNLFFFPFWRTLTNILHQNQKLADLGIGCPVAMTNFSFCSLIFLPHKSFLDLVSLEDISICPCCY